MNLHGSGFFCSPKSKLIYLHAGGHVDHKGDTVALIPLFGRRHNRKAARHILTSQITPASSAREGGQLFYTTLPVERRQASITEATVSLA